MVINKRMDQELFYLIKCLANFGKLILFCIFFIIFFEIRDFYYLLLVYKNVINYIILFLYINQMILSN